MALLVPNQGEAMALSFLVGKTNVFAVEPVTLKLFKNNKTPAEADTEADYNVADFTGYADINLTANSWTITQGAPTEAAYAQQTFTSSAGSQNQNVYGYYLLQTTSGKLVYAERFSDGPYNVNNSGDAIKITPKITAD